MTLEAPKLAIFAALPAQRAYLMAVARHAGWEPVIDENAAYGLFTEDMSSPPVFSGSVIFVPRPPVKASILVAELEKARAALAAVPVRLHIGSATLDTREYLWQAAGTVAPIRLTEKEVAILVYLAQAAAPVSREALLRHVWSYAKDAETHTLETHIYRLRQKIENDPAVPTILLTVEDGYTVAV